MRCCRSERVEETIEGIEGHLAREACFSSAVRSLYSFDFATKFTK
jgi:hypothetical protein